MSIIQNWNRVQSASQIQEFTFGVTLVKPNAFFSYLHQHSQDQILTHPKHGGAKNEMQILSGFTATWMQMLYTVLREGKVL